MPWRNEKCPCGSGKKYKKCCLVKKLEYERQLLALQKVEAAKEAPCPECDSGLKWKDCCLAKRVGTTAKPKADLSRIARAEAINPLPQARVIR